MQLKGLVRFFTVLLILYSIYELSFTWVVRGHENNMATKARQFVNANFAGADSATKAREYDARYARLLDSTQDVTVHYGPRGAISYQEAKGQELNLGLDLKGGINVTLEVEMMELLRSMAHKSTDPQFQKALENATLRKANSSANYITLFVEEYKKLNPSGLLAALFASTDKNGVQFNDDDATVERKLRAEAGNAFDRTYNILKSRIDKFGVAQPNINPDRDRGTITVEMPGLQDEDRVKSYLQGAANLQFWETYTPQEIMPSVGAADASYNTYMSGQTQDSAKLDSLGRPIVDTAKKPQQYSLGKYLVQIGPGMFGVNVTDTAVLRAALELPLVRKDFPPDVRFAFGIQERGANGRTEKIVPLYFIKTNGNEKAPLEGDVITEAQQSFDQAGSKPTVTMDMTPAGARQWENLTERSYQQKRPIAVMVDDVVYSAPTANNGKISGGRTEITGNFTIQQAQDLANILKIGKTPAPAKIVQIQTVGPTLGADAIKGGVTAFAISFAVIFLLMLLYYNTSGWVANIALILNLLFTIGVLTGLGASLTAPGIAGLVLTIGMAVDTNVIIYERIKEELTKGKNYVTAVNEGYKRSLPPVLDAHVTTLLTAIILFSFGLGPVRGFATTQIIGILLSLFCGILVSRWVTDWFTNKRGKHLEYFTPVSRKIFKHAKYKFIEYRKVAYVISFVVLGLGIAAIFNGFDQGVEFRGGRSYVIDFKKPIANQVEPIRQDLEKAFEGEAPTIKTIGTASRLDIITSYQINNVTPAADSLVETALLKGLANYLPAGITYAEFDKNYKVGSNVVLPTISDDLKSGAKWATFWSVLIIALYIFLRFRDWRYSVGTIIALLHDVLITLAVFSFLRNVVPFPLELDQHFIAAVLTVIGFSMNDTVIVFDRIREYSRQLVGLPKGEVINRAINDTLSRTVMTSLTVFLTILILFLVGGEVTKGFAFAMLIGVVTGTYSSIFVAAPILVDLGGKHGLEGRSRAEEKAIVKERVEA